METLVVILGLGIVFIALIALAGVLNVFNLLWGGKPPKKEKAHDITQASSPVSSFTMGLDPKMVAIVIAAITAARGHSGTAFRIAHIEKAGGYSTPVWGHVERATMQTGAYIR